MKKLLIMLLVVGMLISVGGCSTNNNTRNHIINNPDWDFLIELDSPWQTFCREMRFQNRENILVDNLPPGTRFLVVMGDKF